MILPAVFFPENPVFDVTMGSFDRAEVCDSWYIIDKLSVLLRQWDNGLAVGKNASGPELDKSRKEIIAIAENLSITIETNPIETDFVDEIQTFSPANIFLIVNPATMLFTST